MMMNMLTLVMLTVTFIFLLMHTHTHTGTETQRRDQAARDAISAGTDTPADRKRAADAHKFGKYVCVHLYMYW